MAGLIDRIATSLEPDVRATFLHAVAVTSRYVPLTDLEAAIRTNNRDLIYRLLERAVAERFIPELKPLYDALTAAMTAAGAAPVIGATLQFSLTDARVQSWISQHVGVLVTGLANQTVRAVRQIVYSGYTEGFAPPVQARMIRQMVGLTPRLATAVLNYGESLKTLDVPVARQSELIELYAHRLKTHRAKAIARQETFSATMAGRYELWGEQLARGALQAERTWLRWVVVDDDRLCPYCRPMDGKRVRYGQGFEPVERGGTEPVYRTRKPDPYSQKRDLQGRFAKVAVDLEPLTDRDLSRLKSQWRDDQTDGEGWLKYPPIHIQCRCDLVLDFDR